MNRNGVSEKSRLKSTTAMLGLAIYAAGSLLAVPAVVAADQIVAQAQQVSEFNIDAMPLEAALDKLGDQAGVQFSVRSELIEGKTSTAVKGQMPLEQAVRQMLEGTGVSFLIQDGTVVLVEGGQTDAPATLAPIIVTGEKIERSYKDTFTSVGLATQADIEDQKLDQLSDVFNTLANVRLFTNRGGQNGLQIRGLNADGVTEPSNSTPLISVIIDGVTQSGEGLKRGSRGTWDVKQVEVLRGPQSSLQGRNALAGAVVVETNDPAYEYEAAARAVGGQLDRRDAAFMISGPIIKDQLAFRIAGEAREQIKDITFIDSGNTEMAEDKYRNIRGKLLIEPSAIDDLSVLLTVGRTYDQPTSATVSGPDFFDRTYTAAASFTEIRKMDVDNVSLDASYDITDTFTVRSLSSLNITDLELKSVPAAAPFFVRNDDRKDKDFMQDFRFELQDSGPGLSGVAGLFYGDFEQKADSSIFVGGAPFQVGTFETKTKTRAVYADLRYRINNWFSVLGGGRYQWDTVTNIIDLSTSGGGGPRQVNGSEDFRVFLPKVGVAFDIDKTQAIALTASKGYRQGFTESGSTGTVNSIDPEFTWSYELAYRIQPSSRTTLGVNAFYNMYTDQQITVSDPLNPPLVNTENIGESRSYGVEIEGRHNFGNGLQMYGAVGLLRTEFTDFDSDSCTGGSCKGNSYPEAPKLTASLGGIYRHNTGFFVSANGNYTSDHYTKGDINNRSDIEIDGRFIANARIGYEAEYFTVSAFVDNLFDKNYLTGRSTSANEATAGDGRTFGLEVRAFF